MSTEQSKKKPKRVFEIKATSNPMWMPKKAENGSIGYDLIVPDDFRVPAHSRCAIPLNFAINLPYGIEAKIEPRSGFSLKGIQGYGKHRSVRKILGLIPIATTISGRLRFDADVLVGKIDPNYTDTVHVIVKNNDVEFTIKAGTRIAQMTFYSTMHPWFELVDALSCKSRGGGFGSTGTMQRKEEEK